MQWYIPAASSFIQTKQILQFYVAGFQIDCYNKVYSSYKSYNCQGFITSKTSTTTFYIHFKWLSIYILFKIFTFVYYKHLKSANLIKDKLSLNSVKSLKSNALGCAQFVSILTMMINGGFSEIFSKAEWHVWLQRKMASAPELPFSQTGRLWGKRAYEREKMVLRWIKEMIWLPILSQE